MHREVDREARARGAALAIIDVIGKDEPARLLDDAVDRGQAQAGALAHILGGEEGIENPLLKLRRNARAGVLDFHHDVRTGF